jgi:hypothetical protein
MLADIAAVLAMPKQLNIRSDEAYDIAHALARRDNRSVTEIVETALRAMRDRSEAQEDILSPDAILKRYEKLRRLRARIAASRLPDGSDPSDHSDLYDEHGLPK